MSIKSTITKIYLGRLRGSKCWWFIPSPHQQLFERKPFEITVPSFQKPIFQTSMFSSCSCFTIICHTVKKHMLAKNMSFICLGPRLNHQSSSPWTIEKLPVWHKKTALNHRPNKLLKTSDLFYNGFPFLGDHRWWRAPVFTLAALGGKVLSSG